VDGADKRDVAFRQWADDRDERFRRWTEKRDRSLSEYLDALTARQVGVTQQMIDAMNEGFDHLAKQIGSASAQLAARMGELQAEIADQRAQIQANTEALLRVLDRLEPQQGSG